MYSALYFLTNIRWWWLYHFHLLLCHITSFILLRNNSDIQRHKSLIRSIHYPWWFVQNLKYSGLQKHWFFATLWISEACIICKEHIQTFYFRSVSPQPYTGQHSLEYGWLRHYWGTGIQDHCVLSLIIVIDKALLASDTFLQSFCWKERRQDQKKSRYFQLRHKHTLKLYKIRHILGELMLIMNSKLLRTPARLVSDTILGRLRCTISLLDDEMKYWIHSSSLERVSSFSTHLHAQQMACFHIECVFLMRLKAHQSLCCEKGLKDWQIRKL